MSLTVTVKDELALVATENAAQRRAEVSAMLRFAGGLHIVSGRIVVEAELEVRLKRLAARGMTRDEALARIAVQATDEERRAVADVVVSNSGALEDLSAEVDRLWSTRILEPGAIV